MYEINFNDKKPKKLEIVNFSDLELKEKFDIEVWITENPSILKEELLIISEQLKLDSNRRLDLLALDKEGNLVIIELKRDDSGKDVYWQAITYAAQFSEYTYEDILDLYEEYSNKKQDYLKIEEFLEEDIENINQKQRILLVSKEFHRDVLKATSWLLDYTLDIKLIKLTPYTYKKNILLLDSEVLIPTPGIEDYIENKALKNKIYKKRTTFSLKKGNYDDETLKKKLIETFQRDAKLTPILKAFFKILLSENKEWDRENIKKKLFEGHEIGNDVSHAGRLLSNVSQYITKPNNDHLRQIVTFDSLEKAGEEKNNFNLSLEYKSIVEEAIKYSNKNKEDSKEV